MRQRSDVRIVLGFVVAPLIPGLAAGSYLFALSGFSFWGLKGLSLAAIGALLSYPMVAICGVPLFIAFRRRGWNGLMI